MKISIPKHLLSLIFILYCQNMTATIPATAFGEALITAPLAITQLLFTYNINPDYTTQFTTGAGIITHSGNLATISSGASVGSSAILQSRTRLSYQPGQGASSVFAARFPAPADAGGTQIIGIGNSVDGFFFGFNGTTFGILHRNNSVDTWISQTTWNKDTFDGTGASAVTLDTSKGNVFKIQFQYLGFGNIKFFIEDPNTGAFTLVHEIQYANNNTVLSLSNPSLQLMVYCATTSGNPVTIQTGSLACFIEGFFSTAYDTRNSTSSRKHLDNTQINTDFHILSIKNNTIYQSKTNQITVYPDFTYFFNGKPGSSTAEFRLYLNPTLSGAQTFTNINANTSVVSYDTSNLTVNPGTGKLILSFKLNSDGNYALNLFDYGVQLVPGDILTCTCNCNTNSTPVGTAFSWIEKF